MIPAMRFFLPVILCVLAMAPAAKATDVTAAPRLMIPAACAPGEDCWVVNHVDMNPDDGAAEDFTCGPITYDGHEGTDIGVRDLDAVKTGVSVLAAAPGKIVRVRDGMPDRQPAQAEIDRMLAENKGCGNGILIDHGQGWQSIYCHMKSGSLSVKTGDTVAAGQNIGNIGQSGAAEFPHLHFGLFHQNKTVDPFSGTFADEGCGKAKSALWLEGIKWDYEPMAIFAGGFTTTVPDFNIIRARVPVLSRTTPAIDVLAFWVGAFGLRAGDDVKLDIIAPDGSVFATRTIRQDQTRARQYYFVGRKIGDPLLPGTYTGVATVNRAISPGQPETLSRTLRKTLLVNNPVLDDGDAGVILPENDTGSGLDGQLE